MKILELEELLPRLNENAKNEFFEKNSIG